MFYFNFPFYVVLGRVRFFGTESGPEHNISFLYLQECLKDVKLLINLESKNWF